MYKKVIVFANERPYVVGDYDNQGRILTAKKTYKNGTVDVCLLRPKGEAPVGSRLHLEYHKTFDHPLKKPSRLEEVLSKKDNEVIPKKMLSMLKIDEENELVYDWNELKVRSYHKPIVADYINMNNATI